MIPIPVGLIACLASSIRDVITYYLHKDCPHDEVVDVFLSMVNNDQHREEMPIRVKRKRKYPVLAKSYIDHRIKHVRQTHLETRQRYSRR